MTQAPVVSLANGVRLERLPGLPLAPAGGQPPEQAAAEPAELIAAWAERDGERLAVVTSAEAVSYRTLVGLARALAATLPSDRALPVIITAVPGVVHMAAFITCLWCGRPLVFVDPTVAPLRLRQILAQTGSDRLIHAGDAPAQLAALEGLEAEAIDFRSLASRSAWHRPAARGTHRGAVIVFTSGSTGVPKGVLQPVSSLLSTIRTSIELLDVRPGDRLALAVPPSAVSMPAFSLVALAAGATLLLATDRLAIGDFLALLEQHRATHLFCFVGLARALCGHPRARTALSSLRLLKVFGDAVMDQDCTAFRQVLPAGARIFLLYGTSEANFSIGGFDEPGALSSAGRRPLGRALPGASLWLDRSDADQTQGMAGELYVDSPRLATGYWGDPEATQASFSRDPREPGRVFYRTGDIVRLRPDGLLGYLGRRDNQVKLRGWRVELEEIEDAARAVPGVRNAGVVPRRNAQGTVEALALHVAAADEGAAIAGGIAGHLAARLAAHMVPALIFDTPDLPLNAPGKIDRLRLQELDQQQRDRDEGAAAERIGTWPDALSGRIAAIIAEEIGFSEIAPDDVYREIGGDSLRAVTAALRIEKRFAVEIAPEALLGEETLGRIVADIAARARRR